MLLIHRSVLCPLQHFRSLAAENKLDNALKGMNDMEESDQLIL